LLILTLPGILKKLNFDQNKKLVIITKCLSLLVQIQMLAVLYGKEVELLTSVQYLGYLPPLVVGTANSHQSRDR